MKKILSLLLAIIYCGTATLSYAADPEPEGEKTCAVDFPRHLVQDLKYTFFNKWHLLALAAGSGMIAGLHEVDPDVQRAFQPERPLGKTFDNIINWGFSPFILAGAALTTLGITELVVKDAPAARTVGSMFEALLLTEVMTLGLQLATNRGRPDGSNSHSFPSGHTSGVFSLAGVTWGLYGPWYGIPAMTLASLVGVSRIDRNKHVLTDVAAGALLGTLVGLGTARFHKGEYPQYFLTPTVGAKTAGLALTHIF